MDLCDKYLVDSINVYPPLNDTLQYKKFFKKSRILPNHYSKKFNKKSSELDDKYHKLLTKKKELSFCEKVLKHDLDYDKKLSSFYNSEYLPNINDDVMFMYYEICMDKLPPLYTKSDYVMMINRLKSMSGITNDIIEFLKKGIKKKIFLNRLIIDNFLDKSRTILDDKINPKNVPSELKSKFIKAINIYLVKNIKKLNDFILNTYLPYSIEKIGLCAYAGGKKYYETLCKYETLPNLTPEIIHQLGISELKKTLTLKNKLAKKIGCSDIDDYIHTHNKFYTKASDILSDLEAQKKTLYKKMDKYFFHDIPVLYDIEPISDTNMDMTAYYIGPNKGNKGKGTFYINILHPEKISIYELLVLSIHEGIPGHHYDAYITYKSDKPDYIKNTLYSGYAEGWALYCESLFEYTNPKEYYYALQYRVERSLRLIIDTGIHYYGWDYDKCFTYMKKYFKYESDSFIKDQILRYSSIPGQALTYIIGEQVILYLKKEYMKKNKCVKSFHKIILDIGPCPLELLIEKFKEIIF